MYLHDDDYCPVCRAARRRARATWVRRWYPSFAVVAAVFGLATLEGLLR